MGAAGLNMGGGGGVLGLKIWRVTEFSIECSISNLSPSLEGIVLIGPGPPLWR